MSSSEREHIRTFFTPRPWTINVHGPKPTDKIVIVLPNVSGDKDMSFFVEDASKQTGIPLHRFEYSTWPPRKRMTCTMECFGDDRQTNLNYFA